MILVAIGCNFGRLTGRDIEVPTPVPDTATNSNLAANAGRNDGENPANDSEGSSETVTLEKFNRIRLGMSYDEVKEIIGSEGKQSSSTKGRNYETASYEWKGEKFARITARFTNGSLTYKFQSGITGTSGNADIDQAKFNKIEVGMTYDEVKNIIGADGELTFESKAGNFTSSAYRWKGEKFSSIYATFRDGELQTKSQTNLP